MNLRDRVREIKSAQALRIQELIDGLQGYDPRRVNDTVYFTVGEQKLAVCVSSELYYFKNSEYPTLDTLFTAVAKEVTR